MSETEKTIGLALVVLGAALFLWWWAKKGALSGSFTGGTATGGGPAYLDTAADNSVSVTGVPEEGSCPGKSPMPGAKTEGGYGCR